MGACVSIKIAPASRINANFPQAAIWVQNPDSPVFDTRTTALEDTDSIGATRQTSLVEAKENDQ